MMNGKQKEQGMKPEKLGMGVPTRTPRNAVEALERLRVSYIGAPGEKPVFEADQAVQRVVETALQNAKNQKRTA
jgi:hypothetical protein